MEQIKGDSLYFHSPQSFSVTQIKDDSDRKLSAWPNKKYPCTGA